MSDKKIADAIEIDSERYDTHNLLISNLYKFKFMEGINEPNLEGGDEYYVFANSINEAMSILTDDLDINQGLIDSVEYIAGIDRDHNFIFRG